MLMVNINYVSLVSKFPFLNFGVNRFIIFLHININHIGNDKKYAKTYYMVKWLNIKEIVVFMHILKHIICKHLFYFV